MNKRYLTEARLQYLAGVISESQYIRITKAARIKQIKQSLDETFKTRLPVYIKRLENNLIEHIDTNEFFTLAERNAVKLFFKHYSVLNESNIKLFSANILQEGFFDTLKSWGSSVLKGIKSAWQKIKTVVGNIGKWLKGIWTKLKERLIKLGTTMWTKAKQLFSSKKIEAEIKASSEKVEEASMPQLKKEGGHMTDVVKWGASGFTKYLDSKDSSVVNNAPDESEVVADMKDSDIKSESLFDSGVTQVLYEVEMAGMPVDILGMDKSAWQKVGKWVLKALGFILKALAFITNPIWKGIMLLLKKDVKSYFTDTAKLIALVGGPAAIIYQVIPMFLVEGSEVLGMLHNAFDYITNVVDGLVGLMPLEPATKTIISALLHMSHYVFLGLGIFEIIEGVLHAGGFIKGH
jgi:hypothetical protein